MAEDRRSSVMTLASCVAGTGTNCSPVSRVREIWPELAACKKPRTDGQSPTAAPQNKSGKIRKAGNVLEAERTGAGLERPSRSARPEVAAARFAVEGGLFEGQCRVLAMWRSSPESCSGGRALLIAARDGLGASVRDELAGWPDDGPGGGRRPGVPPRDLASQEVRRLDPKTGRQGSALERRNTISTPIPASDLGPRHEARTPLARGLRRGLEEPGELSSILGEAPKTDRVPGDGRRWGFDRMTFVSQYSAVRSLSETTRAGSSAEQLGALARAYANLDVPTEYPLERLAQGVRGPGPCSIRRGSCRSIPIRHRPTGRSRVCEGTDRAASRCPG